MKIAYSRESFDFFLHSTETMAFLFNVETLQINDGSRAAAVKLGYPASEFRGLKLTSFIPKSLREEFSAHLTTARGGEKLEKRPLKLVKKNGSLLEGVFYMSLSDNQGKMVFRDLSLFHETNQHIQSLISLQEKLTLVMNASRIGVWEYDLNTKKLVWDANMYSLYKVDKGIIKESLENWMSLVDVDDQERVQSGIEKASCKKTVLYEEYKMFWPCGERRLVTSNARVIHDSKGKPAKVVGTNSDVTAEKAKEEALKLSNEKLESFAFLVSHDLIAPLRHIISYGEILREELGKIEPDAEDALKVMTDASKKMKGQIDSVLNLVRVNQTPYRPSVLNLEEEVKQIVEVQRSQPSGDDFDITTNNLGEVTGDPKLISVVLQNYLQNAIKFRKAGQKADVKISLHSDDSEHIICVEDNGIGIKADYLDLVFKKFKRLNSKTKYPGSGLGLATCAEIAKLHSGRAYCESEFGVGSKFYLALPKVAEASIDKSK